MTALITLLLYSAVLVVALSLLWVGWRVSGLRRQHNFRLNRVLILSSVAFALLVSALPFIITPPSAQVMVSGDFMHGVGPAVAQPDAAVTSSISDRPPVLTEGRLAVIYGVGVAASAIWFIISLAYVVWLIAGSRRSGCPGIRLVARQQMPFSWVGTVVMSEADFRDNGDFIMAHERVHLQRLHWADLLLLRFVGIITWYAPVVRLIRKDLIECHEYEADAGVLRAGHDPKAYQLLLIEKASLRPIRTNLVNSLNYSSIKKRIDMMQTGKTARRVYSRTIAMLPAALLVLSLSASPSLARAVRQHIPEPVAATDDSKVFTAGVDPEFPGGVEAMYKFLAANLKYPKSAESDNIQGRVILQFIVEKDGSIGEIKVARGIREDLDAEAIRVVKAMPAFNPATLDGKPVGAWYTLPIIFQLASNTTTQQSPQNQANISSTTANNVDADAFTRFDDDGDKVYTEAEVAPEFPGGNEALYGFLARTIRYPEKAAVNNIQGRVVVQFIVDKDGSVSSHKVVKAVDPDLDAEAIRVTKALPKFKPGTIDGKPVRVLYNLPIAFKLSSSKK